MKRALHIAKANIRKNKSAAISLFVIILLVSALTTIGLSVMLGVERDYMGSHDRLNSLHCIFVMSREQYLPVYEQWLKDDPRVSQVEVQEALLAEVRMDYGGELDGALLILNADIPMSISAPNITEQDNSIPRADAIYLPAFAKTLGFHTGDAFSFSHRNRPMERVVAGFFESNELSMPNDLTLKSFAPAESYEQLAESFGRSIWLTARCYDSGDSTQVYADFTGKLDFDLSMTGEGSLGAEFTIFTETATVPVMITSVIILLFSLMIAFISLSVTRFRVTNSIQNAMHDIGVMKASGYTSGQIIACYLVEYGMLAVPAALIGVFLPIPVFTAVRRVMFSMTGVTWTLGVHFLEGLLAALCIVLFLLLMVRRSCARIRKLPPVDALRGGIASNSFRRNYIPLHKGAGGVHSRLGMKNIFVYAKTYMMIGLVTAVVSLVLTVIGAFYMGFVVDATLLTQMANLEVSELEMSVTRHTDADALAAELERSPEVRKTSMLDWITFKVENVTVFGLISDDYSRLENMQAHDGRLPVYDNEIAMPKNLAVLLGKEIGDSVKIRANGITLEYIITGFFSVGSNGGRGGALTLNGYQRHDPNYRRTNINVYLNEGESVDSYIEMLKQDYGILNIYHTSADEKYAAAKARAEEKISNYMEYYGIDSVEYAVLYNGEIILSGSSSTYQIERIVNRLEMLKTQIGSYSATIAAVTQVISVVSFIVIGLILTMTVRQIVLKRRRELGILKSIGFTTKQLARQMAISFLPCMALGILVGCVAGVWATSPLISAMFASTGVYNATLPVSPLVTAALGVLILLFAFVVAHVSALRTRHISAYELLSE